jgi:hypothetical protein
MTTGAQWPWTQLPPLLCAPVLCAIFWAVAWALGHRVLRWLRMPLDSFIAPERSLLSLAIGAGVLQFLPYSLGAFGVLSARALLVTFGALGILVSIDLWRLASGVRGRSFRAASPVDLRWAIWAGALTLLLAILLVRALVLGPISDDDGYHLSAPKRWLTSGSLEYLPTYMTTNASMGFEMLYMIALAGDPLGAKLIHYSAGLFTLLGVWLCARRLGSPLGGRVAIGLLLIANPFWDLPFLFGLAYVDFGACWMTIMTVLVWLVSTERRQPRLLAGLALCAGFAGSFKSTALAVAMAWTPILIWQARRQGVAWRTIVLRGAGLALLAVLPVLPWMFRSWRVTGNPVFPMFASLIPTRDWTPELGKVVGLFLHYYSWGVGSGSHLGEAQRRTIVLVTLAAIVVAGGLSAWLLRDFKMKALAAFASIFIAISVAIGGMVFRYWLPGIICALVVLTSWGLPRLSNVRWHLWLPVPIMIAALAIQLRRLDQPRPFRRDLAVVTGQMTLDQAHNANPYWQVWRYLNANTPPAARVLMAAFYTSFGASSYGGFWVDRTCFTTDSHLQRFLPLDDWSAFVHSVARAQIDYVVIFEHESSAGRHGFWFVEGQNEYAFARRLVDRYGEKLTQSDALQVYRLRRDDLLASEGARDADGPQRRAPSSGTPEASLGAARQEK